MARFTIGVSVALLAVAAAPPGPIIQPGKWENRIEVIDVQMKGAPPSVTAAMKGRPMVVTSCVTPQQAAAGPQAAMNADKSSRFVRYSAAGGKIASELLCSRPGGTMRVVSQGSYTPTSYAVSGTGVMSGRAAMTMRTRTTGRRLGGC
ncbi:MAG: DUF3617 domain-containing protein [Sphingobium sp.]|nr:DUF3617 domain-containing protein [Sphingobium sp.]